MADQPINLNRARKARARLDKARKSNENALKFGRTKAQKAQETAERTRVHTSLDAHRKDNDESDA
ncbi:DUF4169 family protein [Meridianimarinicoccus aquatilis]|uniref:DUF4169 family protein n=1 Tax=Meridianimarinicoccus aquatilis TaxID=2552766 RepID=A0A4R6B1N6_9RHOB|nr:DUF4169 family protein [Fluviibacterium aquatile]TDL89148.1 DUF4169 family protein [Fluviibacterium aquatile]